MPFRNKNSSADKYLRDTGRGGLKAFVGGETTTFFFSTLISTSLEVSELFSLEEEIDSFFLKRQLQTPLPRYYTIGLY